MRRDLARPPIKSSFLSVEKDTEQILRKLLVESRPYSDTLKRLLVIPQKDCLINTDNPVYQEAVDKASIKWLIDNQYIILKPELKNEEFEEKKAALVISFDNFAPTATNHPEFRDCFMYIDCICHIDLWDMPNYQMRPLKILGYIDGILNECRLSGIGTVQFLSAKMIHLNENYSGYTIVYQAVHGSDDEIPREE